MRGVRPRTTISYYWLLDYTRVYGLGGHIILRLGFSHPVCSVVAGT